MSDLALLEEAAALHRRVPVVECHTDVPIDVYRRRRERGETAPYCDDYVDRFRAGGVNVQFLAVGGDVDDVHQLGGGPEACARAMIDDVLAEEGRCGFRVVRTVADLEDVLTAGEVGAILHLEGLAPLLQHPEGPIRALKELHALGVRSAGLVWNGGNPFADGVAVEPPGGLTALGKRIVLELDRLGILVDVAHLAEPGFWDVYETARGPIVATHANAHALCPASRNLTDDQLRAIAGTGGFVGVCFIADFVDPEPTLERVVDHVDHIASLVGVGAVGVGPDYVLFAPDLMMEPGAEAGYVGPEGLREIETLPVFTAALLERGYSEEDCAKILGGNALRVLREVLPTAG